MSVSYAACAPRRASTKQHPLLRARSATPSRLTHLEPVCARPEDRHLVQRVVDDVGGPLVVHILIAAEAIRRDVVVGELDEKRIARPEEPRQQVNLCVFV